MKILRLALIVLALMMISYPFWPEAGFWWKHNFSSSQSAGQDPFELAEKAVSGNSEEETARVEVAETKNILSIPIIDLQAEIIDSQDEYQSLERGAWLKPNSAGFGTLGNTILTAHRFHPNPKKNFFYHLNKVEVGDEVKVLWQGRIFHYQVAEKKIVDGEDLSIEKQASQETLTLYTCHPVWSTRERLVIVARAK